VVAPIVLDEYAGAPVIRTGSAPLNGCCRQVRHDPLAMTPELVRKLRIRHDVSSAPAEDLNPIC